MPTLAPSATLSPIVRLPASPIWAASRQSLPMVTLWPIWNLIVDFGALADHGIAQAAAVDAGAGADLDIVLDQDAAGLRHLLMAVGAEEMKPNPSCPDVAAGMNQDVVADQRKLDRGARPDIAVPADPDVGADHGARPDHGAGADLDPRTDHGQRIDDHTPSSRWADASMMAEGAMPSLSNQVWGRSASACHSRARLTKARNGCAARSNRDMGRNSGFETRADQAGAGFGGCELVGVFEVVEERQMHGAGFVQRSQSLDLPFAQRRVNQYRLRQRGNLGQRRRRGLFEEYRLRHSTRRSPAG